jgi:hypothetical protein
MKYYTHMTDKCLSGWGGAENRIAKYVIECDTLEQAETIKRNGLMRSEMKNIRICKTRPVYDSDYFQVTYRNYDQLGEIWKK